MNKRCILCCGVGGNYPKGLDRQRESLEKVGFTGTFLGWRDEWPPNSPTHQQSPYAFKTAAFREAERQGYELVIWADCSMKFVKHPGPMFERMEERGYYFLHLGWNVSQWCIDEHLPKMQITREEGVKMEMVAATCYGLDLRTERAQRILAWLEARSKDGSYVGPWRIEDGKPDTDPMKVYGHRHDQTALSVIIAREGIKMERPPDPGQKPTHLWDYLHSPRNIGEHLVAVAEGL